jgi:hypothetical protein
MLFLLANSRQDGLSVSRNLFFGFIRFVAENSESHRYAGLEYDFTRILHAALFKEGNFSRSTRFQKFSYVTYEFRMSF